MTVKIQRVAQALTTLVLAINFAACKPWSPAGKAEQKSLDNFTASSSNAFIFNSCSGNNAVAASDAQLLGNVAQKAALRAALSAVPVELQSAFFDTLKGSISIVPDINASCKVSAIDAESMDATLSCWQPGDTNAGIYIKAENNEVDTIRNIRHSVVRAMGFILTDVILKVQRGASGTVLVGNTAFDSVRAAVADALVKDVDASQRAKIPDRLRNNRAALEEGAFAESFDSWYCSTESREKMATGFSETHRLFSEIAAELPAGLRGEAPNALELAAAEGDGLALWGRWGGGNGPIRQGLSNWGAFRANGNGLFNFRRAASGGGLIFQRPWFNPAKWGR